MTAFPRDAVIDRKMFKAENNSSTPAGDARATRPSLLDKFPSPVMFAMIVIDGGGIMLAL